MLLTSASSTLYVGKRMAVMKLCHSTHSGGNRQFFVRGTVRPAIFFQNGGRKTSYHFEADAALDRVPPPETLEAHVPLHEALVGVPEHGLRAQTRDGTERLPDLMQHPPESLAVDAAVAVSGLVVVVEGVDPGE